LARRVRRRTGGTRTAGGTATRSPARARNRDNEGIIPILARAVREVEGAVERGPLRPAARVKFQAVALLVREARTAVRADKSSTEARRAGELKRLDGVATILAKTAARDTSLLSLLAEDAMVTDAVRDLKNDMLRAAGVDAAPEEEAPSAAEAPAAAPVPERRVVPQSVISRQLANPFLTPQFSEQRKPVRPRLLASWELLGPLFKSFEYAGKRSSMDLPDPTVMHTASGSDLMPHQAQVVAAAQQGHRTFLLADEPGLGKTAQALLAAQAADAYPLLCVVPSVVKTNWAREVGLWTPKRRATVVHGDGENVDAFADIVIVNYEVLDRHIGWFGDFGFRGMVVDEAHFIKNKASQRSQHVLQLSERIRRRTPNPLLMALTGTPLINDIEDFRAIWQFLGWIDDKAPRGELMERLEDAGLTPLDPGFYPVARTCVIDMGIVRRLKVEVAKDIPARRVADLPVELDGEAGRSIREAEAELARRLVSRYDRALAKRTAGGELVDRIDRELVRRIAAAERKATSETKTGDNVFSMMRRIGQAKAAPAADYSAQLARSVGKVVFFAKHIDVMDAAEEIFARRGLGFVSIRGDQTRTARQHAIDSFTSDPDVAIAVCSLTAAGVGVNLQAASNVVLAELSWTDAEQTQAIDRVHRIGQEEPVTAWRIIAAQTLDTKIAELIGSKAGLAARALEGSDEEVSASADVQLEALVSLLVDALQARSAAPE
jgi:hypothetical protein